MRGGFVILICLPLLYGTLFAIEPFNPRNCRLSTRSAAKLAEVQDNAQRFFAVLDRSFISNLDLTPFQEEVVHSAIEALGTSVMNRMLRLNLTNPEDQAAFVDHYANAMNQILPEATMQYLREGKFPRIDGDLKSLRHRVSSNYMKRAPMSPLEILHYAPTFPRIRKHMILNPTMKEVYDEVAPWVVERIIERAEELGFDRDKNLVEIRRATSIARLLLEKLLANRFEHNPSLSLEDFRGSKRGPIVRAIAERMGMDDFTGEWSRPSESAPLEMLLERELRSLTPKNTLADFVAQKMAAEIKAIAKEKGDSKLSGLELYEKYFLPVRSRALFNFREFEIGIVNYEVLNVDMVEAARYIISQSLRQEAPTASRPTAEDLVILEPVINAVAYWADLRAQTVKGKLKQQTSSNGSTDSERVLEAISKQPYSKWADKLSQKVGTPEYEATLGKMVAITLNAMDPSEEELDLIYQFQDEYQSLIPSGRGPMDSAYVPLFHQLTPRVIYDVFVFSEAATHSPEESDQARMDILSRLSARQNPRRPEFDHGRVSPISAAVQSEAERLGDRIATARDSEARLARMMKFIRPQITLVAKRDLGALSPYLNGIESATPEQLVWFDALMFGTKSLRSDFRKSAHYLATSRGVDYERLIEEFTPVLNELLWGRLNSELLRGPWPQDPLERDQHIAEIQDEIIETLKERMIASLPPLPPKEPVVEMLKPSETTSTETKPAVKEIRPLPQPSLKRINPPQDKEEELIPDFVGYDWAYSSIFSNRSRYKNPETKDELAIYLEAIGDPIILTGAEERAWGERALKAEKEMLAKLSTSVTMYRILHWKSEQLEANPAIADTFLITKDDPQVVENFKRTVKELRNLHLALKAEKSARKKEALEEAIREKVLSLPLTRQFFHGSILHNFKKGKPGSEGADFYDRIKDDLTRAESEIYQPMAEMNLRLVVRFAADQGLVGNALMDGIQDGNLALWKAILYWQPEYGYKISTYAYPIINKAMLRGKNRWGLTSSSTMEEQAAQIKRAKDDFFKVNGRPPTPEELSEKAGLSLVAIQNSLARQTAFSIDRPANPNDPDSGTMEAVAHQAPTEKTRSISAASGVESDLRISMDRWLSRLTDREQTILIHLHNLGGQEGTKPLTLEQVGKILDLSRERVRQVAEKAKEKLSVLIYSEIEGLSERDALILWELANQRDIEEKDFERIVREQSQLQVTAKEVEAVYKKFTEERNGLLPILTPKF